MSAEPSDGVHSLSEFVAGPENSLAAKALLSCLDRTATQFNPLILYGPHGSGKSHLAHGLASWWRQHFPASRVDCLAASEFAQAYAAALENQQLETWRRQIRGLALLIIEDLGQLAGKRGAQQELLHTLDVLAQHDALVVVTARTLPTHSAGLLAALRSRLSAGLAVPLALPGPGARRAILERLAAARRISLPKRALHSLAHGLHLSVPALISSLLELELAAQVDGEGVDQHRVRQFVAEQASAKMPSLREIACLTAKYFGLKLSDLKSPLRRQQLVAARGVAMYLARQLTDTSLHQVGVFFGGRDHTTVLHGCRRTEKLLKRDQGTRQAILDLKKMLTPS
ncbi:MAG: ATP-binding protein [Planctomycetia bacterium]|nr:ATP-binding protein [Planctomycetia bacterium]